MSEKVVREMKADGDGVEERNGDGIGQDPAGQRCRGKHGEGQG